MAVADSEKRLHIVDVTRNFFRRVTYDSDWPITLAEQALFVNTLTQQANSSQASGVGGREEPGNPMDVLLSDPTTRSPSCTASLRNVCWLSPEKSKMLLLAASFENFLVIFKVSSSKQIRSAGQVVPNVNENTFRVGLMTLNERTSCLTTLRRRVSSGKVARLRR